MYRSSHPENYLLLKPRQICSQECIQQLFYLVLSYRSLKGACADRLFVLSRAGALTILIDYEGLYEDVSLLPAEQQPTFYVRSMEEVHRVLLEECQLQGSEVSSLGVSAQAATWSNISAYKTSRNGSNVPRNEDCCNRQETVFCAFKKLNETPCCTQDNPGGSKARVRRHGCVTDLSWIQNVLEFVTAGTSWPPSILRWGFENYAVRTAQFNYWACAFVWPLRTTQTGSMILRGKQKMPGGPKSVPCS